MRKIFTPTLTIALLIVAVLLAVGIGFGGAPAAAQAQPATASPDTILTQALQNAAGTTSGSGTFDISATVSADTTNMSAQEQAILSQPMDLSGNYSFDTTQSAMQSSMTLTIAGQKVPVGLEVIGGKAWVQIMGQWYDLPVGMMGNGWMGFGNGMMGTGTTGTGGNTDTTDGVSKWMNQADLSSLIQALTSSNIDPSTWITGLTVTGPDNVNGSQAYHITGTVDLNKIMTDIIGVTQNQNLQSVQQTINNWVKNLSVDMWVNTSTNQFQQFQANVNVTPPTGQGDGINSVTAKLTVTMDQNVAPQTFTAPTNTKPFSDLQTLINGLSNIFSGGSTGTTGTSTPSGQ